jgi:hypothetical protein
MALSVVCVQIGGDYSIVYVEEQHGVSGIWNTFDIYAKCTFANVCEESSLSYSRVNW